MSQVSVGGQIFIPKKSQSVDAKYGPYLSIANAYEMLGPDNMDVLCYGLTVGIILPDGNVKEYVITKLANVDNITVNNFIEKYSNNKTYKCNCETNANDSNKIVSISNFIVDSNRKPKDSTQFLLTLINGHIESKMYININNLGNIPVYHNNTNTIRNIDKGSVLYMMYESNTNIFNILNNPEIDCPQWT